MQCRLQEELLELQKDILRCGDSYQRPRRMHRSALQNAASVAGMILTTECMVVDKPEEKPQFPVMQMPGM